MYFYFFFDQKYLNFQVKKKAMEDGLQIIKQFYEYVEVRLSLKFLVFKKGKIENIVFL